MLTFHHHPVTIQYSLKRKTLGFKIQSGQIIVHAPLGCTQQYIIQCLQQKSDWIKRHCNRQHDSLQRLIHYQSKHLVLFKGAEYQVQYHHGTPHVQLATDHLHLTHHSSFEDYQSLLQDWFKQQTSNELNQRLYHFAQRMNETPHIIKLKPYRSRWGSCHPQKKTLKFHAYLSIAPDWVFDSVMIHELAHFKHPNHSKSFWDIVRQYDPYFNQSKQWLTEHQPLMHLDYLRDSDALPKLGPSVKSEL